MNYLKPLLDTIKKSIRRRRPYYIIGLLSLLLYSFSLLPILPPGINQPTAIGPYLNGILPVEASSSTGENWMVENAFPHLVFADPVALVEIPNEDSSYVVGKVGLIWKISNDSSSTTKREVLDISAHVITGEDSGILNAVLHPEFGQPGSSNRGYIYVYYRYHPTGATGNCEVDAFNRLSRFTLPDGDAVFDLNSELVLIQTFDEHCWHGGSGMFFDSEGLFYITVGDAGGSGDEYQTTQSFTERLFSGILRLDLDKDPTRSHPIRRQQVDPANITFANDSSYQQGYYIPNDNPWLAADSSILEEFYALGLRSPHRGMLDTLTGKIWIGDVGGGSREEISTAVKGSNLQWPYFEGNRERSPIPPDLVGVSTPPVFDYNRQMGNSVIGGFVYRGGQYQGALDGLYIFGDHGVRNVWTYNPENEEIAFLLNVPDGGEGQKRGISSFHTNSLGEIFILKLYGTDLDGGVIYKLKQVETLPEPPQLLSQTGAFSDLSTLTPAAGIVPYTVNAPLWSDRALKQRWIALPNDGAHNTADEQITFSETGNWQFPPGTVFIKHFELPIDYNNPAITKRLETRFFVISDNGGAYGVTYKWNDEGTDAVLLTDADFKTFDVTFADGSSGTQTWEYPSRSNCMTCHNVNAEFVLGVHTWQLNGDLTYPSGITDNQLNTWNHLGMFANPFNPVEIPGFPKSVHINDPSAALGTRVRSYLDANCSHCHQPNGVEGAFDARFTTPLESQNLIWAPGISRNTSTEHYIVRPLDPTKSELWDRDMRVGGSAMPPIAKSLVDDDYITVLTAWIGSLEEEACKIPVSGLEWSTAVNQIGPVEINKANGESQEGDGLPITINGAYFPLGLGVHAPAEITYQIDGAYTSFESYVGIDDEVDPCNNASVRFEVYTDGSLAYQSPIRRATDDTLFVQVDLTGVNEVRLVVTDAGDGDACDHADWGDPRFISCPTCELNGPCFDGDPCTIDDRYDANCDCVGTFQDADGDTVADVCDICPGFDDRLDVDLDGVPDGCDICPEFDDGIDYDLDGVPEGCDICFGFDDSLDIDGDGVPYGCDVCFGEDDRLDADGDQTPDACDVCPGFDDRLDADSDGIPDGCDICPGFDDRLDADLDGVPDACDLCPGFDDTIDANNNGIPDACDDCTTTEGQACDDSNICTINDVLDADCNCTGTPDPNDSDGDGVCDAADQCPGFSDNIDTDNDGIPDACDPCVGLTGQACDDGNPCTINDSYDANCDCAGILTIDSDGDGYCDGEDLCQGFDDDFDADADGVPDGCDQCPGFDDTIDTDNDNIPDHCDSCIGMQGLGCPSGDCAVNGNPILSGTHSASQRIRSVGRVAKDSAVVFQAGHNIELKPGFKIEAGASFHAVIVECQDPPARTIIPTEEEAVRITPILFQNERGSNSKEKEVGHKFVLQKKELEVRVRPNPFRKEFRLFITAPIPEMKRAIIRVLDTSGRIIYQQFNAPFDEEISIFPHNGWGNGVYLLQIRASDYSFTSTIVKQ